MGLVGRERRYNEVMIPLPFLPVIAAGLVPFIVGTVWYHPSVFGSKWMSMKHITPEMAERSSRLALHTTMVMIVLGMFSALMLSRVLFALATYSVVQGLLTACGLWLGFVVAPTIIRVLWNHEPLSLFAIESGQWLVSLCIMSLVLVY